MAPAATPEENRTSIAAGKLSAISGKKVIPRPTLKLIEKIKAVRSEKPFFVTILIPAVAIIPNKAKVAPPKTGAGITLIMAPNFGNRPNINSNIATI